MKELKERVRFQQNIQDTVYLPYNLNNYSLPAEHVELPREFACQIVRSKELLSKGPMFCLPY